MDGAKVASPTGMLPLQRPASAVAPAADADGPTAIFVKGIAKRTSESSVVSICLRFGMVVDCQIPRHRSGRSAGFAIVTFSTHAAAHAALLNLNNATLMGRQLSVRWYQPDSDLNGLVTGMYIGSTAMPQSVLAAAMAGQPLGTARPGCGGAAHTQMQQQQQQQQQQALDIVSMVRQIQQQLDLRPVGTPTHASSGAARAAPPSGTAAGDASQWAALAVNQLRGGSGDEPGGLIDEELAALAGRGLQAGGSRGASLMASTDSARADRVQSRQGTGIERPVSDGGEMRGGGILRQPPPPPPPKQPSPKVQQDAHGRTGIGRGAHAAVMRSGGGPGFALSTAPVLLTPTGAGAGFVTPQPSMLQTMPSGWAPVLHHTPGVLGPSPSADVHALSNLLRQQQQQQQQQQQEQQPIKAAGTAAALSEEAKGFIRDELAAEQAQRERELVDSAWQTLE